MPGEKRRFVAEGLRGLDGWAASGADDPPLEARLQRLEEAQACMQQRVSRLEAAAVRAPLDARLQRLEEQGLLARVAAMERVLPAVLQRCTAAARPEEEKKKEPLDQALLRATGEGVPANKPSATVMYHLLRTPSNPFVNPRRGIRPAAQAGQPAPQENDQSQQLPPSDGAARGRADITAHPVVPTNASPFAEAAGGARQTGRTASPTPAAVEAQVVSAPVEQPVPSTSGTQPASTPSRPGSHGAGTSGSSQVVQPKTRVRAVDHASLNNLARPSAGSPMSTDSALQVAGFDCPSRQQMQANLLQRLQLQAQQLRQQQMLQQQLVMRRQHLTPQQLLALQLREQQQLILQQRLNIRQYQAQQQLWGSMQMRPAQQLAQQQLMAQRQQLYRTPPQSMQTPFQPLQTQTRMPQAMYQGTSTRTNDFIMTPSSQIPSRQLPPHSAPPTSFPNLTPIPTRTLSSPSFLECPSTYSTFPPRPGPSNMPTIQPDVRSLALSTPAASLQSGSQESSCRYSCQSLKSQMSQRSLPKDIRQDLGSTGSQRLTREKDKTEDTRSESQLSDPTVAKVKSDIPPEERDEITTSVPILANPTTSVPQGLPIQQANNATEKQLEDAETVSQEIVHRKVKIEDPMELLRQQQNQSSSFGALDTKGAASPEIGTQAQAGTEGSPEPGAIKKRSCRKVPVEEPLEIETPETQDEQVADVENTSEEEIEENELEEISDAASEKPMDDSDALHSEQSQSESSLPTGERAELGVFTKDEISSDITTHEADPAKVAEKKESILGSPVTVELSSDISTPVPDKDTGDIQEEEFESVSSPKDESPLETKFSEPKKITKDIPEKDSQSTTPVEKKITKDIPKKDSQSKTPVEGKKITKDIPKKDSQSTTPVEEKMPTVTTSTGPEKVSETNVKTEPPVLRDVKEDKGAPIDAGSTVKESLTVGETAKAGGGESVENATVKKDETVEEETSDETVTAEDGDTVAKEPDVISEEPPAKEEPPGAVEIVVGPKDEVGEHEVATTIFPNESSVGQNMELVLTIPLGELDIGTAPFRSTEVVGGVSGTLTVDVTSGKLKSSEMQAKLLTRPQENAAIQTPVMQFPLGLGMFPFGPFPFALGADVGGCKPGATCHPTPAAAPSAARPPAATAATVLGYAAAPAPRPCGCAPSKPGQKETKKEKNKKTIKPRKSSATRSCPREIKADKLSHKSQVCWSNPPCCHASPTTPRKWRPASVTVHATSGSSLAAVLRHASPAQKAKPAQKTTPAQKAAPTGASCGRPSRARKRSES